MIMDRWITVIVRSVFASRTEIGFRASIQPTTSLAELSGNLNLTTQRSPGSAAASGSLLRPATSPAFLDGPQ
jgi:hypothetical protein